MRSSRAWCSRPATDHRFPAHARLLNPTNVKPPRVEYRGSMMAALSQIKEQWLPKLGVGRLLRGEARRLQSADAGSVGRARICEE